jgi:hypothetical protein
VGLFIAWVQPELLFIFQQLIRYFTSRAIVTFSHLVVVKPAQRAQISDAISATSTTSH